mmetsp:Transcript_17178/g.57616  ORF Transcript_17178/g.57616 Transcript_17178/m.57616 type:complete len:206 (+) Transcript_17178:549-1166(+)
MYSSRLAAVTGTSAPPSLSSTDTVDPNRVSAIVKSRQNVASTSPSKAASWSRPRLSSGSTSARESRPTGRFLSLRKSAAGNLRSKIWPLCTARPRIRPTRKNSPLFSPASSGAGPAAPGRGVGARGWLRNQKRRVSGLYSNMPYASSKSRSTRSWKNSLATPPSSIAGSPTKKTFNGRRRRPTEEEAMARRVSSTRESRRTSTTQ